MEVFLKIIQLVLSLSLLVLVHELGHFMWARLCKMRVDKFYLFFNPSFSILRAKRIEGKWQVSLFSSAVPEHWNEYPEKTEWGIGWLPLGGYCKIAGMIDESMDKEQLKQEPKSWEYRSKPARQRLWVLLGGVLNNLLLAFLIYAGMLYVWGDNYLATKDAKYGIHCNELALELGFRHGDIILAFDGQPVERLNELQGTLLRRQAKTATVLRGADTLTFDIDQQYFPAMLQPGMFDPRLPFIVGNVPDSSHNFHAGLMEGDRIVAINDSSIFILQDIHSLLKRYKQQEVKVGIQRNDTLLYLALLVNNEGELGIIPGYPTEDFIFTKHDYNLLTAIPAGAVKGYKTVNNYLSELKLIFSPKTEAYKSVGSFITIGKIFPGSWSWYAFWSITAFLSIMLAVINILPIPGLDGGHTLFVCYELVTRRKPSDKFLEYAQIIGFIFLIAIMVLAFGNDIYRLFK
ncbi:MAG: RIP metalloprotease RseP [Prevotellaceae bacterium]|jgi:regulator of sigma E protease|nr:RIP metalloprotease RseP [Prevotellaceae bacterium]